MRLSCTPERGYRVKRPGEGYRVLMDGRQLERVVKVDTVAGVAWVADTDKDGKVRIDRQKQEVILRRVLGPMRLERLDG